MTRVLFLVKSDVRPTTACHISGARRAKAVVVYNVFKEEARVITGAKAGIYECEISAGRIYRADRISSHISISIPTSGFRRATTRIIPVRRSEPAKNWRVVSADCIIQTIPTLPRVRPELLPPIPHRPALLLAIREITRLRPRLIHPHRPQPVRQHHLPVRLYQPPRKIHIPRSLRPRRIPPDP